MSTLNKYELNRLDSYCKFKKYEKFRPMSSIFVLSIYIIYHEICMNHPVDDTIPVTKCHRIYVKRSADDMIPVTESRDMDERGLRITQFL